MHDLLRLLLGTSMALPFAQFLVCQAKQPLGGVSLKLRLNLSLVPRPYSQFFNVAH